VTATTIEPFGDEAILVTLGDRIDVAVSARTRRVAAAVTEVGPDVGLGPPVQGYAAVLVPYDIERLGFHDAQRAVEIAIAAADEPSRLTSTGQWGRLVEIPTIYGGAAGEDLELVAEVSGLSAGQVVELHASTEYEVFILGFSPGFPYMGIVPDAIALPRRPAPRARVPAGTVAIADRQTGIYPVETPGGWNLIGRTELVLWDPFREPPSLLAAGDRVRFVPVT
jgi:KipI family sensor histidine kinase inhibitor